MIRKNLFLGFLVMVQPLAVTAGPLGEAARNGDIAAMTELLDGGADVNEPGMATPLQLAAMFGQTEAVALLIDRGADVDASSSAVATALHAAAQAGHANVLSKLLDAGADYNSRDKDNYTPLMTAVRAGKLVAVQTLLAHGVDPSLIAAVKGTRNGGRGRTIPLHLAINFGHPDIADELVRAGASPVPPAPSAELIAAADPNRGRTSAFQWCGGCHVLESEETEGAKLAQYAGPTLLGIFGRRSASIVGYDYTDALKRTNWIWDADRLYAFTNDPMLTVPGTLMRYRDDWTEQESANIVAYFQSAAE